MIITSQSHKDDAIVNAKRAAKDYVVTVSPMFAIDGEWYQVILDGHHSFEAAIRDGVDPEYREATSQDHDAIGLIAQGKYEEFLEAVQDDDDFRDAYTSKFVW